MALILDGTDGITSSGGTNVLQAASVEMSNLNATGTPSASNFLRGDGSWQTINTTPTTTQVLDATAGASVGAVGTYSIMRSPGLTFTEGQTTTGSNLRFSGGVTDNNVFANTNSVSDGGTPSGTWRCMGSGTGAGPQLYATLWLRIS
jgi:hypothetical protein